ncbi:MAG TPA: hypothetical protein VF653_12410, partial [Methylomirabilota bacterium]
TSPVILARLVGPNKALLSNASFGADAYDLRVFDKEDASTPLLESLAEPNDSPPFFATLQTDGYWDIDARGYNFRLTLDPDDWSDPVPGGHTVRAEIKFKPTGLGIFWLVADIPYAAVLSE